MTIIKVDSKGNEYNYGGGYKDPYEVIPKNYKFNGFFMKQVTQRQYTLLNVIHKKYFINLKN